MSWKFAAVAAAVASLICAAPAMAAVTIYTSKAAFDAATHAGVTDSFEVAPDAGSTSYGGGYFAPLFQITADNAALMAYGANTGFAGWGAGDVMAYQGGTHAYFHFYAPVTAFSIEVMTSFPTGGAATVSGAGFNSSFATGARPAANFFGVTSATGLTDFTLGASGNYGEFDNLTLAVIGAPTPPSGAPEPASWALMIAGFGLAGAALRRRVQATAG